MNVRLWLWAVGLVVALGSLGGLYAYVRQQGYDAGRHDAEVRCEADKARQQHANDEAMRAAEERLFKLADELSIRNMELDDALSDIDAAAAAGPGASDQCLDAASVRRLQTIN